VEEVFNQVIADGFVAYLGDPDGRLVRLFGGLDQVGDSQRLCS
jgi:hypothetical protein